MLFLNFRFQNDPQATVLKLIAHDAEKYLTHEDTNGVAMPSEKWNPHAVASYQGYDVRSAAERTQIEHLIAANAERLTIGMLQTAIETATAHANLSAGYVAPVGSYYARKLIQSNPGIVTPAHIEQCVSYFESDRASPYTARSTELADRFYRNQCATGEVLTSIAQTKPELISPDVMERLVKATREDVTAHTLGTFFKDAYTAPEKRLSQEQLATLAKFPPTQYCMGADMPVELRRMPAARKTQRIQTPALRI